MNIADRDVNPDGTAGAYAVQVEELIRALAALDDPTWCEGELTIDERIALMLPDGDVAAVDDPQFVAWLIAHGEPAPFGRGGETVVDPAVRSASRLTARGEVRVHGFEPTQLLAQIEAALSPHTRLEARLTDVTVYAPGGHFARHKDTPATSDLIGTLVVGLPIEHAGGAFAIGDVARIDWSGRVAPRAVRWVAMFTDVDHAVEPVTSGARVTLVYALHSTDRARDDARRDQRIAALRLAVSGLEPPDGPPLAQSPLMIACARLVIAPDAPQPQPVTSLRGRDRDVAKAFEHAGYRVAVRTCLAVRECNDDDDDPDRALHDTLDNSYARLREPLMPSQVAALLDCIVFDEPYHDDEVTTLAPWVERVVPHDRWVFRTGAAATFLRELLFANDGFVGNGAVTSYLYKLAALEITR